MIGLLVSECCKALRQDNESDSIRKDVFEDFSTMSSDMSRAEASAVKMEDSGGRLRRRRLRGGAKAAAPTAESDLEPSV